MAGELLAQLVELLEQSGAKYTILYASQPSGLLENPSSLPLSRHLAEKKINDTKAGQSKCDGECLVKSSLLEGTFVVSCYLCSVSLIVSSILKVGNYL